MNLFTSAMILATLVWIGMILQEIRDELKKQNKKR